MRFAACLKKDIRLLTGGGWRTALFFVLPVLLALLMTFAMKDAASAEISVGRVDISVRDLDDTVMSRLLISQLDGISLFDSVIRAGGESDEALMQRGVVASVTIPKDFFYDLYDMRDTDVIIALNADRPAEAAMVKSAFSSLVGILEENQRLYYASARARYGDLDEAAWNEVYHEYSNASAEEALNRLSFFDISEAFSREYDARKLFFASSVISMLILFIPLALLRSVPEELDSGLTMRYAAAGGGMLSIVTSKLVISFVMTLIPSALVTALIGTGGHGVLALAFAAAFLLSFGGYLFIGCISKNAAMAQLLGNLVMLVTLFFGGGLIPAQLLPEWARGVSRFTVPGLITRSMQYAYLGRTPGDIALTLLPYAAVGAALILACLPFFFRRRRA